MTNELETARRNVYRLQKGGDRLADALRKIAEGCDNPELVARKALNHLERDPKDWSQVEGFRAIEPTSVGHAVVLEDLARRIDDE